MRLVTQILLVLLSAASLSWAAPGESLAPDPQQGRAAKLLAYNLPMMHLNRVPWDDQVATSALDIFLNALDYEHCYFLAPDIEAFRAEATKLDDQLRAGNVEFAFRAYALLKERVSNRVAYVNSLLDQGFDTDTPETYTWKRKSAPWPADETEWNELWRKKIKNEYIARLVSQQLGSEEKALDYEEPADQLMDAPAPAMTTNAPPRSPADIVRNAYRQYQIVLNDNDANWLIQRYLTSFAQAYDPHSDYLTDSSAEDFEINMKLSLTGIGAMLTPEDGAAKVERLIVGGPAAQDGRLKPGDKIIAVAQGDGEPVDVLHWPLSRTVRLIRGPKGTKVVLTVIPASDTSGSIQTRIDLIRDEVKIEEQAAKGEVREVAAPDGTVRKLGVIKLPEFYGDLKGRQRDSAEAHRCSVDVQEILRDFKEKNVDGVLLDLRNNGGGFLSEAVELTGLFIPSGPVVQVKDQRRVHILSDPKPETVYDGPLVVLVNRLSASASEIVAGALQDYGRAVIVGDSKTHGKGTVQTMTYLNNANPKLGSLKVTTASFYRIAGGSTQKRGITPDIVIPSLLDSMEIGEETLPHSISWSTTDEAFYEPVADVREFVPTLLSLSITRRNNDPRFSAYTNLLARVAERQHTSEITLKLDDRLELARSEKQLQDLLEETDPGAKKEDGKKDDLVLLESLQILNDLVGAHEQAQAAAAAPGNRPRI